jgi:putative membrane protein
MTTRARRISTGVVAGVAGGLIASYVMELAMQPFQSKEKEEPATIKAASAVTESTAHHQLTRDEKKTAGPLVHYLMGGVSGAIYGAVAAIAPATTVGFGTLFGAVVWLLADEIAVPAFGLSKNPAEYPLKKHLTALASHLVYGATTDATRRAITAAI